MGDVRERERARARAYANVTLVSVRMATPLIDVEQIVNVRDVKQLSRVYLAALLRSVAVDVLVAAAAAAVDQVAISDADDVATDRTHNYCKR